MSLVCKSQSHVQFGIGRKKSEKGWKSVGCRLIFRHYLIEPYERVRGWFSWWIDPHQSIGILPEKEFLVSFLKYNSLIITLSSFHEFFPFPGESERKECKFFLFQILSALHVHEINVIYSYIDFAHTHLNSIYYNFLCWEFDKCKNHHFLILKFESNF